MNVGMVGIGSMGSILFNSLSSNIRVKQIFVFDPQPLDISTVQIGAHKVKICLDAHSLFENGIDLLVVSSPDDSHFEYLEAAVSRGIHCFVEKPAVLNLKELQKLEELTYENPKVLLTSNLVLRSAPLFSYLRQIVQEGRLGKRLFFEGKYLYGRWGKISDGWRGQIHDYSVILGGLIHLIDLVCFMTAKYDYEVSHERRRITSLDPQDFKDIGITVLDSRDSGVAVLSAVFASPTGHRRDFAVYGDKGCVEVKGSLVQSSGITSSDYLERLSPYPDNKSQLLIDFIEALSDPKDSFDSYSFPSTSQTIALMKLCFSPKPKR
jgi:predicted dehydrogenase